MPQYAAALEGVKQRSAELGANRTAPGSVDALAASYYKLVFPRLKASTRPERRFIIERFRVEHGTKPVRLLKREHIETIIAARWKTPHAGNNLLKALRTLCEHAIAINSSHGLAACRPWCHRGQAGEDRNAAADPARHRCVTARVLLVGTENEPQRLAESAVGRLRQVRAITAENEQKLPSMSSRLDKTGRK
jgi:hypothetical protein